VTTAATAYNGTAGSGSSVGTYATAASGAIDNNYNISYVGGTLTVNKANLTISADSQSMTYGGIMPTLTASYTGLVNGDSSSSLTTEPSIISATPATANAGTYNGTITASGALDNNYTISYAAGNLTINKAPLTISADNQAITYGASVPTGSITYNGLVNGDSPASLTTQPTLTTTQSGVPNAGTYADAYTVSGAASGNYTLSYIDGTLTVQKLNLTVTTYDQSINLGQPLPTFTGSNNLLAQDVPLVGWNYAPISYSGGIGTYQIGASASDPYNRLANYNIAMNDGTLAVLVANASQLPPTVQVTSQNPLSDVTSYAPTGIVSNPNSNSSGANNLSGAVFATSSNGALVKTFGMLDIVMTPALQQQLGYTYTPQTN
jgi:lipopolysaccharide export system protein LptA